MAGFAARCFGAGGGGMLIKNCPHCGFNVNYKYKNRVACPRCKSKFQYLVGASAADNDCLIIFAETPITDGASNISGSQTYFTRQSVEE